MLLRRWWKKSTKLLVFYPSNFEPIELKVTDLQKYSFFFKKKSRTPEHNMNKHLTYPSEFAPLQKVPTLEQPSKSRLYSWWKSDFDAFSLWLMEKLQPRGLFILAKNKKGTKSIKQHHMLQAGKTAVLANEYLEYLRLPLFKGIYIGSNILHYRNCSY